MTATNPTTLAASEAWRTMLRLMFEGEGHGRVPALCRTLGIPPSMIKTLMNLSPDEPRAMRDLAEHWGCDASYVTTLVDDLEERGFAERRPHPTDRRVKTIVLTPAGADLQRQVSEALWQPPQSFAALDDAEACQLRDLLLKVAGADPTLSPSGRVTFSPA